jgi:hypothetical protein
MRLYYWRGCERKPCRLSNTRSARRIAWRACDRGDCCMWCDRRVCCQYCTRPAGHVAWACYRGVCCQRHAWPARRFRIECAKFRKELQPLLMEKLSLLLQLLLPRSPLPHFGIVEVQVGRVPLTHCLQDEFVEPTDALVQVLDAGHGDCARATLGCRAVGGG